VLRHLNGNNFGARALRKQTGVAYSVCVWYSFAHMYVYRPARLAVCIYEHILVHKPTESVYGFICIFRFRTRVGRANNKVRNKCRSLFEILADESFRKRVGFEYKLFEIYVHIKPNHS